MTTRKHALLLDAAAAQRHLDAAKAPIRQHITVREAGRWGEPELEAELVALRALAELVRRRGEEAVPEWAPDLRAALARVDDLRAALARVDDLRAALARGSGGGS